MTRACLRILALAALAVAGAAAAVPARAQAGTVESIEVQGLGRMSREAFLHAFGIRAGDPYDPARIRAEFRKLWGMGLFSDIVIDAEDSPQGGKVLIVKVKERPVLVSLSFEENKVLTRTQIEDRLKEKKTLPETGKPLDMKKVFEAETAIRDLLGEKGYLDGKVGHRIDSPTETTSAVRFSIVPGGKTKIRQIRFVGNKVYSERKLKDQLQLTRAWRWWWPGSSKSLYHPAKWDQDVGSVRDLYLNNGYLDVDIKPPVTEVRERVKKGKARKEESVRPVEAPQPSQTRAAGETKTRREIERDRRRQEKAQKKADKERQKAEPKVKRWVYLTVPISEGPQYRLGKVSVTGNAVFTEEEIRKTIPLREGDVLSNAALKGGMDLISRLYGIKGYLYATAVRQIDRRKDEPVADVAVTITEDKPYYVARIEFSGNTFTRDRVLRREMRLREGDLFNRNLLDASMTKVNQLGYFQAKEEPVIEPIEGENRVRITVRGEEQSRNTIQVGGGYSGYEGAYFAGSFSTQNFLGRGQTFALSAQIGGRTTRYSLSFLEPWFLNRPYTAGFSLYRRDYDYGNSLTSSGKGAGIVLGRHFGLYTRVTAAYNFEKITTTRSSTLGGQATSRISSLTPGFSHDRVNNPYRPSRGWSAGLDAQIAGGFLGGDTSYIRPVAAFSAYRRLIRRTFLALHAEAGQIRPWQGGGDFTTATLNGVPLYQRFFIGGDQQGPRVFDVRTITPLRFVRLDEFDRIVETVKDPRGRKVEDFDRNGDDVLDSLDLVETGGDRYFLLQSEYVMPLGGPAELAAFVDAGNSLFEDMSWGFDGVRVSAGFELRFYLPVFPVPLRLIYGWPVRKMPEDQTSNFQFSIGRSF